MNTNFFGERTVLMIPGPTELHPAVQRVLSSPIMAHYGPEWAPIYNETLKLAAAIFKTKQEVFMMPTPGTVALETGVVSLIEPGEKVVAVVNGFFSERLADIASLTGAETIKLAAELGKVVDPNELDAVLSKNKDVKAVLAVQNETSTGVLNPIPEYAKVARQHDALFVVDAISSYGGVEMEFDGWGIDFCVGYANKCLGSIPGTVPVAVSERAWEAFRKRRTQPRSFFTNLGVWRHYIDEWAPIGHPYPTTISPHAVLCFKAAAEALLQEGLENRYSRHRLVSVAFRKAVRSMGLETLPEERDASPVVTAVALPSSLWKDGGKVGQIMLQKHRIMIGGGLAQLHNKIIRIGHMCVTASSRYIVPTLAALRDTFQQLGYTLNDGVETFMKNIGDSG
ncbi:MAG: alanine--glyoxylate aminotransferase family protein [Candidatus Caldarchaeum sp.]|uniref:Alanine--glyoxylate aminotransferase family protein n=1 Tax=Caldiarchaeum subterraneum TaxID=311458 RepID=A0A7C4I0G6_CALS0|nr:alanine--glyoxylate aminotransferase family protein [Candidatus Caldarchaeales archaeon]